MAIDADLRSALTDYFERFLDGDQKLRKALSKAAKSLPPNGSVRKQLEDQISHLSARITNTDNLLKQLETRDASISAVVGKQLLEYTPMPLPVKDEAEQLPAHDLTPFEEALVRVYNSEPENWRRRYRPSSFGAANVDEIWRTGGDPKFTRKEGGIYHLVEADGRGYVVPEPGLRLQENYFRSEGINYLFTCPNFRPGSSWARILVVSPAVVQENGDRWTVSAKGELRERT
jgi:hypothetical protein